MSPSLSHVTFLVLVFLSPVMVWVYDSFLQIIWPINPWYSFPASSSIMEVKQFPLLLFLSHLLDPLRSFSAGEWPRCWNSGELILLFRKKFKIILHKMMIISSIWQKYFSFVGHLLVLSLMFSLWLHLLAVMQADQCMKLYVIISSMHHYALMVTCIQ